MRPTIVTEYEMNEGILKPGMLPDWEDIPAEFKNMNHSLCIKMSILYYTGSIGITPDSPKIDINHQEAIRHIRTIMSSPDHSFDHKISATAYLFNEWFDHD